jgi:hypothetical protein
MRRSIVVAAVMAIAWSVILAGGAGAADESPPPSAPSPSAGIVFVGVPGLDLELAEGQPMPAGVVVTLLFEMDGVTRVEVIRDDLGQDSLLITLDAVAADALDTWAAGHTGERIAIVADGIVLSAPVIRARSFDGQIAMSGPEMGQLAAALGAVPATAAPSPAPSVVGAPSPEPAGVPSPEPAGGPGDLAAVLGALDPRFRGIADYADLRRRTMRDFRPHVLTGSYYRLLDTIRTDLGMFGEPGGADVMSRIVEVTLVRDCADVETLPAADDPCAWRHTWYLRIAPDGAVTTLFEEGSPDDER